MAKNSIVMICKNIKLDKNYQNVLTYTEEQMRELCYNNRVNMANNFSFVLEQENSIIVPFSYVDSLTCNYMAFQNPRYSNKWFFAFIDSVEYNSDKSTKINFTVDLFSTWFDYWSPKSCFVVREHTMDDTVGSNTIPEGLETGDFIAKSMTPLFINAADTYTIVAISEFIPKFASTINPYYSVYTGLYSGLKYIIFDDFTSVSNFIRAYNEEGKTDAIYSVFVLPRALFPTLTRYQTTYNPLSLPITLYIANDSDDYIDLYTTPDITIPNNIDGYVPKNNKLFIGDYNYLMVSNNVGQNYTYKFEDFINNTAKFKTVGAITMGGSIKTIPLNYKKFADDEAESLYSWQYGITAPKYPTCSWITDPYTNWLTQNSINVLGLEINKDQQSGLGLLGVALGAGLMATGVGGMLGAGLIAGGASGMFNNMQNNYQHDKVPLQAEGSTSSGDVTYSAGHMYIPCFNMTIKQEYARSIDDYFTRFGYKTNRLKVPNQTGRRYFNYVEIAKGEIIGYPNNKGCPADALEQINNMYRSGITLWHDHSRIGNYEDNTILTQ